jgi:hypothetical protein
MIAQTQTTSFKAELYEGIHNLLTDNIKIALYTANANLNEATTAYSSDNEVSGTGYSATGKTLTGATVSTSSGIAYVSFNNIDWTSASFTCRGALIYNATKANRSIAVLNFGSDKTVLNNTFLITFPANTSNSAIIRSSN